MEYLRAWWFWSVLWLLTVFTLVGNGFIVYLIASRRRLHTTANWFLLSLASAYFGVGSTFLPTMIVCELWPSCDYLVDSTMGSVRWYFLNAIVMNLCAVVFDRYIAITKPLTYRTWMKKSRVFLFIVAAWMIPISVPISVHLGRGKMPPFLFHEIAGGIFIVTTVHVLIILRRHCKHISKLAVQLHFNSKTNAVKVSVHKQPFPKASTLKFVLLLLGSYFISYSVDITAYIHDGRVPTADPLPWVVNALRVLQSFLLMMNPAVYSFACVSYRSGIKKEIKRFLRRKNALNN